MSDQTLAPDSLESEMSDALERLDRIARAIPELPMESVETLAARASALRDRAKSIEDAAQWRRWRLDAADLRRTRRPFLD